MACDIGLAAGDVGHDCVQVCKCINRFPGQYTGWLEKSVDCQRKLVVVTYITTVAALAPQIRVGSGVVVNSASHQRRAALRRATMQAL